MLVRSLMHLPLYWTVHAIFIVWLSHLFTYAITRLQSLISWYEKHDSHRGPISEAFFLPGIWLACLYYFHIISILRFPPCQMFCLACTIQGRFISMSWELEPQYSLLHLLLTTQISEFTAVLDTQLSKVSPGKFRAETEHEVEAALRGLEQRLSVLENRFGTPFEERMRSEHGLTLKRQGETACVFDLEMLTLVEYENPYVSKLLFLLDPRLLSPIPLSCERNAWKTK